MIASAITGQRFTGYTLRSNVDRDRRATQTQAEGRMGTGYWYALPGAGTALGVVAGALERLLPVAPGLGFGGTSGGGLVALALASGMSATEIGDVLDTLLRRKDLLDKGWPFDQSPGLYRGARIEGFARDVFGAETRLGDLKHPARVCAWDAWTCEPCVFDSVAHRDVLVWRAARATMAIEFFFDLVRARADNARLYGDGGLVVNVPHGLWDDKPEPTIGVRFSGQHAAFEVAALIESASGKAHPARVCPVRTWADLVPAVARTALRTASASWPSKKAAFQEVVLESAADGMAFGLAAPEVERRRDSGRRSGERAAERFKS
jgi:predicted acylesterase/phospholipase RssA